jgi:hypothetical protein
VLKTGLAETKPANFQSRCFVCGIVAQEIAPLFFALLIAGGDIGGSKSGEGSRPWECSYPLPIIFTSWT